MYIKLDAAYSLNTWKDSYTDHYGHLTGDNRRGFYAFGLDTDEKPVPHTLYIADPLFDFKSFSRVKIEFRFEEYQESFREYFDLVRINGKSVKYVVQDIPADALPKTGLRFTLLNVEIPRTSVDGIENNWLSFSPSNSIPLDENIVLPEIDTVSVFVESAAIIPDALFFNTSPVDAKKGFYPFGETPQKGSNFYIGCDEVFSKPGTEVSISFDMEGGAGNTPVLAWQYWNGTTWLPTDSGSLTDGTADFQNSGEREVSFTCPSDIVPADINGVETRWIRVKLESGDYGRPATYEETNSIDDVDIAIPDEYLKDTAVAEKLEALIKAQLKEEGLTFGYKFIEPTYAPPFIKGMRITYSHQKDVDSIVTLNNFEYQPRENGAAFAPYVRPGELMPSFFIGFKTNKTSEVVRLYYSMKGRTSGEALPLLKQPGYVNDSFPVFDKVKSFDWFYHDGDDWKDLAIVDGTDFFTKNGIITFNLPPDIALYPFMKKPLYWIKIEARDGRWFEPPLLKGIFPNTVYAESASRIKAELLGSSNAQPDQTFTFSKGMISDGQMVEVREPDLPTEEELEEIEREEGHDAWRPEQNGKTGETKSVWIRWHEVNTFVHSGPKGRHYLIDRERGSITFGDGKKGMVPPAGVNNIVAREYKSVAGGKGLQKTGTLTKLKTTIPGVDSVTNVDSSTTGRAVEKLEDILNRTPYSIKNRNRAITREDFEKLALESTYEISKARCLIEANGTVKIIIAPNAEADSLYPDTPLLNYITAYLEERAFFAIRKRITVESPRYQAVDINAEIVPVSVPEGGIVASRVREALQKYLHPLEGGKLGAGWDFGEDIALSEIAILIEDVEGVDYVKNLMIADGDVQISIGGSGDMILTIPGNVLPCAGKINITLVDREG